MKILQIVNGAIGVIEGAFMTVAVVVMNAIMLIVTVDVALRYIFNSPLPWTFDVVSIYLMVALFFLSVSDTLQHNRHVSVDILHRFTKRALQRSMELVGYVASLPLFWIMFERGSAYFWDSYVTGAATVGNVFWPTWMSAAFIPLGLGLLLSRIVFRVCALVVALINRAERVEGAIAAGEGGGH